MRGSAWRGPQRFCPCSGFAACLDGLPVRSCTPPEGCTWCDQLHKRWRRSPLCGLTNHLGAPTGLLPTTTRRESPCAPAASVSSLAARHGHSIRRTSRRQNDPTTYARQISWRLTETSPYGRCFRRRVHSDCRRSCYWGMFGEPLTLRTDYEE